MPTGPAKRVNTLNMVTMKIWKYSHPMPPPSEHALLLVVTRKRSQQLTKDLDQRKRQMLPLRALERIKVLEAAFLELCRAVVIRQGRKLVHGEVRDAVCFPNDGT